MFKKTAQSSLPHNLNNFLKNEPENEQCGFSTGFKCRHVCLFF